ncbi:MAG TPA: YicC/YloC family endoribonuclease [Candidatus Angelobacter sp.]|nr:YicC/YloC family endoribonuclease [Candidatus Angelobacter sp.]
MLKVRQAKIISSMPIRSMTGFAQVKSQAGEGVSFSLSLKSVNHRFLDPQLRLPADTEELEIKLRRVLKERLARGHVEVTLSVEQRPGEGFGFNRELVGGYVAAFRKAAAEFGAPGEPDLNAVFRMPGALAETATLDGNFEQAVLAGMEQAIEKLNVMREHEGQGMEAELRRRLKSLEHATEEVSKLRSVVTRAVMDKVRGRMKELLENVNADEDRILQEAALLAERSDIQEELVRLQTHIDHFRKLLDSGGELGKKLDFLLQELNREANTLLSKTTGVTGEALHITELGLQMKSEIEKCREQVQNLE